MQRRRQRRRHWRRPANGARRVEAQPRVDALDVEEVAAVGQNPNYIGALVIGEAYGAAGGGGVLVIHLRFGEQQLRVAGQRRLVQAHLHRVVRRMRRRPGVPLR